MKAVSRLNYISIIHEQIVSIVILKYVDNIKIDTVDNPLKATISSDSVWGILRGLETFSQLVYSSAESGVAVII